MLAIVRLNPQRVHRRQHQPVEGRLHVAIADAERRDEVSQTDAINQVAAQNQAWQGYRRGEGLTAIAARRRVDAAGGNACACGPDRCDSNRARDQPAATGPDGELRIVAGDNARVVPARAVGPLMRCARRRIGGDERRNRPHHVANATRRLEVSTRWRVRPSRASVRSKCGIKQIAQMQEQMKALQQRRQVRRHDTVRRAKKDRRPESSRC